LPAATKQIDKNTLDSTMFVALRDSKTKLIKNINTIHDLNIGVVENVAHVTITGRTECRGAAVLTGGAIGALKLPGGAPAIIAGDNVIVAYNNNNTVTITASVSAGELGAQLDALETLALVEYNLSGLDLSNKELRSCHLVNCDLRNCNFANSNISHSEFTNSDLRGAIMTGVINEGTDYTNSVRN